MSNADEAVFSIDFGLLLLRRCGKQDFDYSKVIFLL